MSPIAQPAVQMLTVGDEWAGQRLDNFLLRELKGAPKTLVYRIIRSGEVRINKGRAKADTKLQTGDVLRIPPLRLADKTPASPPHLSATKKEAIQAGFSRKIAIIHEENGFLAIDKPAGLAVHGGSGISLGLIETLRAQRQAAAAGVVPYLELVHRLDRETSGILLVAKKRSALVALQAQFKNRSTGKTYLALVRGAWPAKHKVIDQALRKYQVATGSAAEERRVEVVAKDHPDAMHAVSLVRVLGIFDLALGDASLPVSLLAVTIKTGRTHQIRVHLASNGHPILGDDKYGDFALNKHLAKKPVHGGAPTVLPRMFLHAWQLQVQAPQTEQALHLCSPLPPELLQTLPQSLQEQVKNVLAKR